MSSSNPPPRDVRMKGFAERALVPDVLTWLRSETEPLDPETCPLGKVSGRVLGQPITAPIDVPSFDRSAMDGYALVATATDGASPYNPLSFSVIGESLPGSSFSGSVDTSSAARIMTGAPIPSGADCVVPAEHANESSGTVEITSPVAPGRHIGRRGEDVQAGQLLLEPGRTLRPQDTALIGSLGIDQVEVLRRPIVRLLITGYESNSLMLAALAARDGGVLETSPLIEPVSDDRHTISSLLSRPGADVILVSGGTSVGTEDHAPVLVSELGTLFFHGVAMRPSSPTGIGRVGDSLVFLLPGNPVSCLAAYDVFAGEMVRKMSGMPPEWPYTPIDGVLNDKIASDIGRLDYCRVSISDDDASISPLAISGASILSSTTRADGFVLVPSELEGYAAGRTIQAWRYDRRQPGPRGQA